MAFEGAEKLLEISFLPWNVDEFLCSADHRLAPPCISEGEEEDVVAPPSLCGHSESASHANVSRELLRVMGLRVIGRDLWQEMLNIVKCQILSIINNEFADAYLLSESSLFIYPYKIILKTCGTTTLLLALPRLLELAFQVCRIHKIKSLFYSRKSFRYPEIQPWPHSSWQDEVDLLDNLFGNGAAYIMGNTNSEHWYLYAVDERPFPECILGTSSISTPCQSPYLSFPLSSMSSLDFTLPYHDEHEHCMSLPWQIHDHTLEILMTGLCPKQMQRYFYVSSKQSSQGKPDASILNDWIPGLHTDSFQFDPCGWSQNGLLESVYTTIHVTPEAECSYASFETNLPQQDPLLIQKILSVFKPNKVTITLFTQRQQELAPATFPTIVMVPGYQLVDLMINMLPNHYLFYGHYVLDK